MDGYHRRARWHIHRLAARCLDLACEPRLLYAREPLRWLLLHSDRRPRGARDRGDHCTRCRAAEIMASGKVGVRAELSREFNEIRRLVLAFHGVPLGVVVSVARVLEIDGSFGDLSALERPAQRDERAVAVDWVLVHTQCSNPPAPAGDDHGLIDLGVVSCFLPFPPCDPDLLLRARPDA